MTVSRCEIFKQPRVWPLFTRRLVCGVFFPQNNIKNIKRIKIKGDVLGRPAVCDLLNSAQERLKLGVVLYPRKEKDRERYFPW